MLNLLITTQMSKINFFKASLIVLLTALVWLFYEFNQTFKEFAKNGRFQKDDHGLGFFDTRDGTYYRHQNRGTIIKWTNGFSENTPIKESSRLRPQGNSEPVKKRKNIGAKQNNGGEDNRRKFHSFLIEAQEGGAISNVNPNFEEFNKTVFENPENWKVFHSFMLDAQKEGNLANVNPDIEYYNKAFDLGKSNNGGEDKVRQLYNILSKDEVYSSKVGTEDEFILKMSNPAKARQMWSALSQDPLHKDKIGSEDEFMAKIGLGKQKPVGVTPPTSVAFHEFLLQAQSNGNLTGIPESYDDFIKPMMDEERRKGFHGFLLQAQFNGNLTGIPESYDDFMKPFISELP